MGSVNLVSAFGEMTGFNPEGLSKPPKAQSGRGLLDTVVAAEFATLLEVEQLEQSRKRSTAFCKQNRMLVKDICASFI